MRLLLDTHIALWAVTDSPQLGSVARGLILAQDNAIFVSAASVWEIAIKHALSAQGRGEMPVSAARAVALFALSDYQALPIAWAHAEAVALLPVVKAHADPFDRLLVAQVRCESMMLLTRDSAVAEYGAGVILV